MFHLKKTINQIIKHLISSTIILFLISTFLFNPNDSLALSNSQGENLFIQHCSGCHVNGGNIIRRNKTLKLSDLKRNGLDNPDAIAEIARNGIGIMNGYEKFLGEGGDKIVANWIWEEAQKT